jgi:hypothetical protein
MSIQKWRFYGISDIMHLASSVTPRLKETFCEQMFASEYLTDTRRFDTLTIPNYSWGYKISKMNIRGSDYPLKKIFSDDFVFTIPH